MVVVICCFKSKAAGMKPCAGRLLPAPTWSMSHLGYAVTLVPGSREIGRFDVAAI